MRVAIVRYNAGNIRSVETALERLGASFKVTDQAGELLSADRVIFPGVGEASSAMAYLRAKGLDKVIPEIQAPVLGICLGMQLLGEYSEEGATPGLAIVRGVVRRFVKPRKIPHVWWSQIQVSSHPLFSGISKDPYFYFTHSYRMDLSDACVAGCAYGETFAAAIARDNFMGVQFHPERSGSNGERLLSNFLSWRT